MTNHPCHFCGLATDKLESPNEKTKTWFIFPSQQYPICPECQNFHSKGDSEGIVGILSKRWDKITLDRKEAKLLIKAKKEVQNE